jgi:hypothetical protein
MNVSDHNVPNSVYFSGVEKVKIRKINVAQIWKKTVMEYALNSNEIYAHSGKNDNACTYLFMLQAKVITLPHFILSLSFCTNYNML